MHIIPWGESLFILRRIQSRLIKMNETCFLFSLMMDELREFV